MSKERPHWILSAYAPGREAPIQLFGGLPREQSFEELRFRHYELSAQGRQQEAIQEAQTLVNNAEQQIQTALNDVDGAIKYIVSGENEHPNRIDVVHARGALPAQAQMPGLNQQPSLAFGQSSSTAPAFGQPSLPSAFARPSAPSFGQPSAPTSTFGQASTSSFGQPSAFGQPSTLGRPTTAFGQASQAFGNSSTPAPAFGQPSAPSAPSPFGVPQDKPSPFGLPSGTGATTQASTAPFGQSSGPAQPSPFGQPSAASQSNVVGKPSALSSAGPFGQPTPIGATASMAPPNPFGQPTAPASKGIFGEPPVATTAPTGQSSKTRISYANRPVPGFGFSVEPLNLARNPPYSANNPTAQPSNATTFNGAAAGARTASVPSTAGGQEGKKERISSWKGKPVSYIDNEPCFKGNDGAWQKIWFPHGPPVFKKTPGLPDEAYSTSIKDDYKFLKENGVFNNGVMPELPPKREWCNWDF